MFTSSRIGLFAAMLCAVGLTYQVRATARADNETGDLQVGAIVDVKVEKYASQYVKSFNAAAKDKSGRVTVTLPIAKAVHTDASPQGAPGFLTLLTPPNATVTMEVALKHPEMRDTVDVKLTATALEELVKAGVSNPDVYFAGHVVKVTGMPTSSIYLCFPAVVAHTITVEHAKDIQLNVSKVRK